MTDGTVERAGWLEKGGWRIGIRSDNGNYYYYAHLESYVGDWKEGDQVQAGDLLALLHRPLSIEISFRTYIAHL